MDAAVTLAATDKENLTVNLLQYMDNKIADTLCASMHKPGGMIDGPAPAGGLLIVQICDPGVFVSTRAEMNMKTSMAQHYSRTSRLLQAVMITEASICKFKQ